MLQGFSPIWACSIFVLTDGRRAFFANNEDWSDPRTRIWFVPGVEGRYGCVYVGFQNHWAQGGLNTKGLAFDWVAGYKETYRPDPNLQPVTGNPSEEMMQTCASVEEAIRFYQRYQEPSFSYARILVADRSGASVIVRASGGHLEFDKASSSRGFGYGGQTLETLLATNPPPSPANASRILRACLQKGTYATKYSNVFDLSSGEIFLYPFADKESEVKLSLAEELQKGEHFYDMPGIREQMKRAPKLWPSVSTYQAIPDKEPKVTARVHKLLQDGIDGKMRAEDFAPGFWDQIAPKREAIQSDLKSFGELVSVALVDRGDENGRRVYRYRFEFKSIKLLQRFVFDEEDRVADVEVEDSQR